MSAVIRVASRAILGASVVLVALVATASASTITTSFGAVQIVGENDADNVVLSSDGTNVTITDTGPGGAVDGSTACTQVNATTVSCDLTPPAEDPIQFFGVQLLNGVDSFTNQNFVARGEISSFSATGAKTINAGPGPQFIGGGSASDTIDGGDGDDNLFDGGGSSASSPTGGDDTLIGGAGTDSANYDREIPAALSLTLDGLANDGQAGEADNLQVENIFAGQGDDVIVGDGAANQLVGSLGDDTISGMGGNDELFGEFGEGRGPAARGLLQPQTNDVLDGGAGRDALLCGTGFDLAIHDPSDDVDATCERIGAELDADSAALTGKKRNKAKIGIACAETEGVACTGRVELSAAEKTLGKGKFSIAPGETGKAKVKLKRKGSKAVAKAGGSLLVTVHVLTDEPGGVTETSGRLLVYR